MLALAWENNYDYSPTCQDPDPPCPDFRPRPRSQSQGSTRQQQSDLMDHSIMYLGKIT